MARTAEDAALMLDAMIGISDVSPISVVPPWRDLAGLVRNTMDVKGLRIACCVY
jgi:amidase